MSVFHGYPREIRADLPPGVQGVFLLHVLRESPVRIGPGAEVVHLAPDLLGLHPGGVGEQGEVIIGFSGLA